MTTAKQATCVYCGDPIKGGYYCAACDADVERGVNVWRGENWRQRERDALAHKP